MQRKLHARNAKKKIEGCLCGHRLTEPEVAAFTSARQGLRTLVKKNIKKATKTIADDHGEEKAAKGRLAGRPTDEDHSKAGN